MTDVREDINRLQRQIDHLNAAGDFADGKMIRARSERLEERVAKLELANTALLDTIAALLEAGVYHLADRHDARDLLDNRPDTISLRKAKHRLRRYADESGLTRKRADLTSTRQDEGRLRPKLNPDRNPAPTVPRAPASVRAQIAALPTLTLPRETTDARERTEQPAV